MCPHIRMYGRCTYTPTAFFCYKQALCGYHGFWCAICKWEGGGQTSLCFYFVCFRRPTSHPLPRPPVAVLGPVLLPRKAALDLLSLTGKWPIAAAHTPPVYIHTEQTGCMGSHLKGFHLFYRSSVSTRGGPTPIQPKALEIEMGSARSTPRGNIIVFVFLANYVCIRICDLIRGTLH